jgi:hypothetical protein
LKPQDFVFPSEAEFDEWWKDKVDDQTLPTSYRCETCPIARFLRAHGCPKAWTSGGTTWYMERDNLYSWLALSLPEWAQAKRNRFDKAYSIARAAAIQAEQEAS